MSKVAIGCVVRNRAWVLPEYLAALKQIDYPNKAYIFLENDSEDTTLFLLQQFKPAEQKTLQSIKTGVNHWKRGDYGTDQFANLANLRNMFLEMFLQTDADFLFSVDSDVIMPPDVLSRLLANCDQKTIIGAAISNVQDKPLDGKTPGNFLTKRWLLERSSTCYELEGVMDIDIIGAVYLIPRQAIEDGVRYGPHTQGEDVPFCLDAKQKEYRLQVLLDSGCEHRMVCTKQGKAGDNH